MHVLKCAHVTFQLSALNIAFHDPPLDRHIVKSVSYVPRTRVNHIQRGGDLSGERLSPPTSPKSQDVLVDPNKRLIIYCQRLKSKVVRRN